MELLQPKASRLIGTVIHDFYDRVNGAVNVTLLVEHVADVLDCQGLVDDSESWLWDLATDRATAFEDRL